MAFASKIISKKWNYFEKYEDLGVSKNKQVYLLQASDQQILPSLNFVKISGYVPSGQSIR